MKPKKPKHQDQADLFRSRLDQILDRKHPLFILANQIDWSGRTMGYAYDAVGNKISQSGERTRESSR